MKIRYYIQLLLIIAVLTLVGCRSHKNIFKSADPACVTAKMKYKIAADRDKMSLSGSMKMKKNEVIRLQIVALGIMEVARLELTPDYILFMDRMNKRYSKAQYDDVTMLSDGKISFKKVQKMVYEALKKDEKTFSFKSERHKFALDVTVESLNNDCDWDTYTEISSRYQHVPAEEILKTLSKQK